MLIRIPLFLLLSVVLWAGFLLFLATGSMLWYGHMPTIDLYVNQWERMLYDWVILIFAAGWSAMLSGTLVFFVWARKKCAHCGR